MPIDNKLNGSFSQDINQQNVFLSTSNTLEIKDVHPFAIVYRHITNNPKLSLKAKGLLLYFVDKPNGWKFTLRGILHHNAKETRYSLRKVISELKEHGYVNFRKSRDETGKYNGYVWSVTQFPKNSNNFTEVRNSNVGKSDVGVSHPLSNTHIKKEDNKETMYRPNSDNPPQPPPTPPPKSKPAVSSSAIEITDKLEKVIMNNHPKIKPPKIEKWRAVIDRMLRVDKRDVETTKKIIDFADDDVTFWKKTLMSAEGLRRNWDTINAKMEGSRIHKNKEIARHVYLALRKREKKPLNIHVGMDNFVDYDKDFDIKYDQPTEKFKKTIMETYNLREK